MAAKDTRIYNHSAFNKQEGLLGLSNPVLRFLRLQSLITHLEKLKWLSPAAENMRTGNVNFLETQEQASNLESAHYVQRPSTATQQCKLFGPNLEHLLNLPHHCGTDKELDYSQACPKEWSPGPKSWEVPAGPRSGEGIVAKLESSRVLENVLDESRYLSEVKFYPTSQQTRGQVKLPVPRYSQSFGLVFHPPLVIGLDRRPQHLPGYIHASMLPHPHSHPRLRESPRTLKGSCSPRWNICATREQATISIPRGHNVSLKASKKAVTMTRTTPSSGEHTLLPISSKIHKNSTGPSTSFLRKPKTSNLELVGGKQPRMAPRNICFNDSLKNFRGPPANGVASIVSQTSKGILSSVKNKEFHMQHEPEGDEAKPGVLTGNAAGIIICRDECSGSIDLWSEDPTQAELSTNSTLTQDNKLYTELEAKTSPMYMSRTPRSFEAPHEELMVTLDRTKRFSDNYQYANTNIKLKREEPWGLRHRECKVSKVKVCRRWSICGGFPYYATAIPYNPMWTNQTITLKKDAKNAIEFPVEDTWRTKDEGLTPNSPTIDLPYRNLVCPSLSTPQILPSSHLTRTPSRIPIRCRKGINHTQPEQVEGAEGSLLASSCHPVLPRTVTTSVYKFHNQSSSPNPPGVSQSQINESEVGRSRTLPSRTKRKHLSEEPLRI